MSTTDPVFHTLDVYSLTHRSVISDQIERAVACETDTRVPIWDSLCEIAAIFLDSLDVAYAIYAAPHTIHEGYYWRVCEFQDEEHGLCIVRASTHQIRLFMIDVYDPKRGAECVGPVLQTFRYSGKYRAPLWNEFVDFARRFCMHMADYDARLGGARTYMPERTLVGADWIAFTIARGDGCGDGFQVRCRRVGGAWRK